MELLGFLLQAMMYIAIPGVMPLLTGMQTHLATISMHKAIHLELQSIILAWPSAAPRLHLRVIKSITATIRSGLMKLVRPYHIQLTIQVEPFGRRPKERRSGSRKMDQSLIPKRMRRLPVAIPV